MVFNKSMRTRRRRGGNPSSAKSHKSRKHTRQTRHNHKLLSPKFTSNTQLHKAIKEYLNGSDKYKHISTWDVSRMTDFTNVFNNAIQTDKENDMVRGINNWDVSNAKSMKYMFHGCNKFNQPLDKWDVSNVTDMRGMFGLCYEFNQPLNSWNVSKVKDMSAMFYMAYKFNKPLDKWDMSSVENTYDMFTDAESFNQPLNNWNINPDKLLKYKTEKYGNKSPKHTKEQRIETIAHQMFNETILPYAKFPNVLLPTMDSAEKKKRDSFARNYYTNSSSSSDSDM